jgi:hypothetical protein
MGMFYFNTNLGEEAERSWIATAALSVKMFNQIFLLPLGNLVHLVFWDTQ